MPDLRRVLGLLASAAVSASLLVAVPNASSAAPARGLPNAPKARSVDVHKVPSRAKGAPEMKGADAPVADGMWSTKGKPETIGVSKDWSDGESGLSLRRPDVSKRGSAVVVTPRKRAGLDFDLGPVFEISSTESDVQASPGVKPEPAPTASPTPTPSDTPESDPAPTSSPSATPSPSASPDDESVQPDPEDSATPEESTASLAGLQLEFDISDYAERFGGGWAARLRPVLLDECADTKSGELDCAVQVPLDGHVSMEKARATVTIPDRVPAADKIDMNKRVDSGGLLSGVAKLGTESESLAPMGSTAVVALMAGPNGTAGDYTATQMTPNSSWSGGNQSGDFTWSYPFEVPDSVNGPAPVVWLVFASGSVVGRATSTNPQTSVVGEGFSFDPGSIERHYETCKFVAGSGSNAPTNSYDLCWYNDNLTISLNGKTSQMVRVNDTSVQEWRLEEDDGTRIRRIGGAVNRDENGEHFVVTTKDGTQYWYGRDKGTAGDKPATNSVSTVAVFGSKAGQPCHESTFRPSACRQAWRWGLDYVVDPNGNSMTYFYDQEENYYGAIQNTLKSSYDRSGLLKRVEYGTRAGSEGTSSAPVKVEIGYTERCLSELEDCTSLNPTTASHWYDLPYDQLCTESASSCPNRPAPTFWSRKRLTSVNTYVYSSGYQSVDQWTMNHWFLKTGDGDPEINVRTMVLKDIEHAGKAGGTITLPKTTFGYTLMDNRVDQIGDGIDDFRRFRITEINNGMGGSIGAEYDPEDCTYTDKPASNALSSNARRCFPVWFQPIDQPSRQLEFFHKYRIKKITETPESTSDTPKVTSYVYGNGAGWHYEETGVEQERFRTWNQWRGYDRVQTHVGSDIASWTLSDTLYLRGMDGDRTDSGGTKSVTVTDFYAGSPSIVDKDYLKGFVRRVQVRNGQTTEALETTVNDPVASDPGDADWGPLHAWMVNVGKETVTTPLSGGGPRTTETNYAYDDYDRLIRVDDKGDTSLSADNQCTVTTYAQNTTTWMLDYPATEITADGACVGSSLPAVSIADDVIEASRTRYDGGAVGAAPTKGNVTASESASGLSGGTISYQTDATYTYDAYGRVLTETDANSKTTQTTYTPATGLPTLITTKNPLNQTSSQTIGLLWGQPTRETNVAGKSANYTYDALGRLKQVWGPDRNELIEKATAKFTYTVSDTGPNSVTTETLNAGNEYAKQVTIYDGLLRERSTQATPASNYSGRVVTHTEYDSRGLVVVSAGPYWNSGTAPNTALEVADDDDVAMLHRFAYDGAARPTGDALVDEGSTKFTTATAYVGEQVRVTPPAGGTPTTTITDARGQTTELRQHRGATPSGTYDSTIYTYTPGGQLKTTTNQAGTVWSNNYDIRGNRTSVDDPDAGHSTTTYDALDRVASTTDARGLKTFNDYDALGRKTAMHYDSATGPVVGWWTYDTIQTGQLTFAARATSAGYYTQSVGSYDNAGRPTSTSTFLTSALTGFYRAGGYVTDYTYNPDGTVNTIDGPDITGLPTGPTTYTYDSTSHPTGLDDGAGLKATLDYSPLGQTALWGVNTDGPHPFFAGHVYDRATGRITQNIAEHFTASTATEVLNAYYAYDDAGNILSIGERAPGDTTGTDPASRRECFTYDYLQRLKAAWTGDGTTCQAPTSTAALGTEYPYWETFGYDTSGNRTSHLSIRGSGTTAQTTISAATYPAPTAAHPHAVQSVSSIGAGAGTRTFAYDDTGNRTSASTSATNIANSSWDREGNLTSVTDPITNKSTTFTYDINGTRLVTNDQATNTTTVDLGDIELTRVGATGPVTATQTVSLGGQPMATRTSSGQIWATTTDHHGTPIAETDVTTGTTRQRRYTPFGEPLDAGTGWSTDHGYLGKTTDPNKLGTTHLDAREYDPTLGAFTSVDPIVDPTDPQQLNANSYAKNSPVTMADPNGLWVDGGQQTNRTAPVIRNRNGKRTAESGSRNYKCSGCKLHGNVKPKAPKTRSKKSHGKNIASGKRDVAAGIIKGFGRAFDEISKAALRRGGVDFDREYGSDVADWFNGFTDGDPDSIFGILGQFSIALLPYGPKATGSVAQVTRLLRVTAGSERVAKSADTVVLGHYPEYVDLAKATGGRTFQVPTKVWDSMAPTEQWAANQKFLDRAIARGSNIQLATRATAAREGSFFERELQYMQSRGYSIGPDDMSLIAPGGS